MNAEEREKQSLELVRKFALASVGVGIFAGPLLDFVALTALLVLMIEKLAARYQRPFYPSLAKSLVASLLAASVQYWAAYSVAAGLLKFVPFVGWGAVLLVSPAVAYAVTHAIGTLFIMHFESGGTLLDFDIQKMHEEFGRRYRASMRHAPANTTDGGAVPEQPAPAKQSRPAKASTAQDKRPAKASRADAAKAKASATEAPSPTAASDATTAQPSPEPAPRSATTAAPVVTAATPVPAREQPVVASSPVAKSAATPTPVAKAEPEAAEAVDETLKDLVVKSYQSHSYQALCDAPTDAIRGVSDGDAQLLREVFAVTTVAAFARFTWTEAAEQVLAAAASAGDDALPGEFAARLLNSEHVATPAAALANLPVTALKGLGEKRAKALDECFRTKTIEKLATLKFVTMARTIVARAEA